MEFEIFDNFLDAILVVDSEFKIHYCNQAAANLVGLTVKRITRSQDIFEVFHFSKPLYDGSLFDIKEPTPYVELNLESNVLGNYVLNTSIQPVSHNNNENRLWIVYLKDISVEVSLKDKFDTEQTQNGILKLANERDGLTDILNKKTFDQELDFLFDKARSKNENLSLIFFDIDNFKNLNDTAGHLAGDAVLKEVAKRVKFAGIRDKDVFARFGGEEFVLILPSCDSKNAFNVAERVRKLIADTEIWYEGKAFNITVSLGVASLSPNMSAQDLLKAADSAAYESKAKGKNQVSIYHDLSSAVS